ncbi:monomeric sarcosine oxidase-like [Littorina saxatilis]|uniref:FAD dependent oxidoreductase domain-containing protein n=1 Tax=Littorina saxatilis TaxID=31220 RepID=A0AAN9BG41_9CAEN
MADGLEAIGSRRHFQYIVVGCGGIGSGAVYWLSKRAPGEVLGLEQFELGHERGGSQDVSRIIRLTYHDDRYTKLTPATFEAWAEVERESGQQLVFKCGGLQLAERGSTDHIMEKYAVALDRNNIPYERLSSAQLKARYPQFTPPPNMVALYQKDAGLVDAALGNSTHVQLARGNGAVVIDRCPVLRIRRNPAGNVEVTTTKGTFTCRKLVVTAGAWLNDVLGSIGVHVPVTVTQEQVTYFGTPHIKDFTKDRFPIWIYHTPRNDFYALPVHGNSGTKIGIDAGGPPVTGNTRTFQPDPVRTKTTRDLLEKILPKFLGPEMFTKTCLYTMTMDRHFVVDTCTQQRFSDVIVCCGAGHAYKFASLLGKILSEMAVDGRTQYDISQFNIDRPAVTDPNFKPTFYMGLQPASSKL